MNKRLLYLLMLIAGSATAGDKMKFYFNHPVDNSVATISQAVYLNNCLADTLIAYINRSKYTLDIAVYNFTSTSPVGPSIATAINNAYARGVRVRWIYDGAQSNTGLPSLNAGINKLASPTTSSYTIMHNKFMIADANSPDPSDAIVWTGSANWNTQQFNYDYNNVVVLQDAPLAKAYRAHFNMMWGDTGIAPNASVSKFGQFKTDLGTHDFTIDGKEVHVYFSPADGTNSKILATIATAEKDMYFGMYTFTDDADGSSIASKNSGGVYVAGIVDNYTVGATGSEYGTLSASLGARLKVYSGSDLYHDKLLIVDPSDACADPIVLTGSHNWTFSADTKNDENTIIIHSAEAANVYYQSFKKDFQSMGGSLSPISGCPSFVTPVASGPGEVTAFATPKGRGINLNLNVSGKQQIGVSIYNITGQIIYEQPVALLDAGTYSSYIAVPVVGVYYVRVVSSGNVSPITQVIAVY
jgi:hypothetical protein